MATEGTPAWPGETGQYDPEFNDGAWTIPGWTAQNMAYPAASSSSPAANPEPVLPNTLVTGDFDSVVGRGAMGQVTCRPNMRMATYNGTVYELDPVAVEIVRGSCAFYLAASADEGAILWEINIRLGPSRMVFTDVSLIAGVNFSLASLISNGDITVIDGGTPSNEIFDTTWDGGAP